MTFTVRRRCSGKNIGGITKVSPTVTAAASALYIVVALAMSARSNSNLLTALSCQRTETHHDEYTSSTVDESYSSSTNDHRRRRHRRFLVPSSEARSKALYCNTGLASINATDPLLQIELFLRDEGYRIGP